MNFTDMSSGEEAGPGDPGWAFISGAEVNEVGRAPGVDESCPEFPKAVDAVGLSWLTQLLKAHGHRGQCEKWTGGCVPTIGDHTPQPPWQGLFRGN